MQAEPDMPGQPEQPGQVVPDMPGQPEQPDLEPDEADQPEPERCLLRMI